MFSVHMCLAVMLSRIMIDINGSTICSTKVLINNKWMLPISNSTSRCENDRTVLLKYKLIFYIILLTIE